jgi:alkaline phosphatase D
MSCAAAAADRFQVDYRAVEFVDRPGACVSTIASFQVEGNKLRRVDL